uniref:Uncharacterized protein n=1 Tax=Zea mays TaxID=4577 RepID=A0A804LRA2_MAIZE
DKRHISKYLWHSLLSYTQACTRTHVLHFLDEVQENDIAPACSAKPISSGPISAESGPRRLFTPPSPPPTSQAASATFQKTPTSCHTSIRRRRRRHLLPLSSHSDETLFSIHLSIHGVARPRHPGRPRRRPPPGSGRAPPRPAPPRPARLRHHLLPAPVRAASGGVDGVPGDGGRRDGASHGASRRQRARVLRAFPGKRKRWVMQERPS